MNEMDDGARRHFSYRIHVLIAACVLAISPCFAAGFGPIGQAPTVAVSAQRKHDESHDAARVRTMSQANIKASSSDNDPWTRRFLADDTGLAAVESATQPWNDLLYGPLSKAFDHASDRYLPWTDPQSSQSYERRVSWRYPHDGCFARTTLFNRRIADFQFPAMQRLFVFGDLETLTSNAESGSVAWWYHVVPVTRVDGDVMVVDPAIDPLAPMPVRKWLDAVVNATGNPAEGRARLEITLCDTNAHSPASRCLGDLPLDKDKLAAQANQFLDDEWHNMEQLGKDPVAELIDGP